MVKKVIFLKIVPNQRKKEIINALIAEREDINLTTVLIKEQINALSVVQKTINLVTVLIKATIMVTKLL